jgi:hypothetical protein
MSRTRAFIDFGYKYNDTALICVSRGISNCKLVEMFSYTVDHIYMLIYFMLYFTKIDKFNHNPATCITLRIKQTPSPLVRKRTIPTERPPLVDEI